MNTFKRKIYSQFRLWKEISGNRKSKSRIDFLQRRGNKVCQLEVKSSVSCLPIFMVPFLWCVVHCCSPPKTKLASSGIESSFGVWWNYFRCLMKLIYLRREFFLHQRFLLLLWRYRSKQSYFLRSCFSVCPVEAALFGEGIHVFIERSQMLGQNFLIILTNCKRQKIFAIVF